MSSLLEGRTKPLPVLAQERGNAGGSFRGCLQSSGDLLGYTNPFLVFVKTASSVNTGRQPSPTKPLVGGGEGGEARQKMNHCERDVWWMLGQFMELSAQFCRIQHWWKRGGAACCPSMCLMGPGYWWKWDKELRTLFRARLSWLPQLSLLPTYRSHQCSLICFFFPRDSSLDIENRNPNKTIFLPVSFKNKIFKLPQDGWNPSVPNCDRDQKYAAAYYLLREMRCCYLIKMS